MSWQWWQRSLSSFSPAGTTYESLFGMGGSPAVGTETQLRAISASDGNIRFLRVVLTTAPGVGNSRTFTLYKNGSSTAMTVTISDTNTTNSITTDISVSAGDRFSMETTRSGTPTGAGDCHIALAFDPTTEDQFTYPQAWANGNAVINSAGRYNPALGSSSSTPTADAIGNSKSVIPIACTLDAFYVDIRDAPGVGTNWTLILVKNGTEEASTSITISAGTTTGNVTGLGISLAVGDVLTFKMKAKTGAPTTTYCGWGVRLIPTNSHQWILGGQSNTGSSISATNYVPIVDTNGVNPVATETNVDIPVPFSVTVVAMAAIITTAPSSGKNWTYRNRKNVGNGSSTFQIADANTTGNDTAHSDDLVQDDLIDISITPSGTPTAMGASAWAMGFRSYVETQTIVTSLAKVAANINVDESLPPLLTIGSTLAKITDGINASQSQQEAIVTSLVKVRASINANSFSLEPNEVWVETWEEQDP